MHSSECRIVSSKGCSSYSFDRHHGVLLKPKSDLANNVDHARDVAVMHTRIQRQRDQSRIFRERARARVTHLQLSPVIRMQWDGDEVDAAIDTPLAHLREKLGSVNGQAVKLQ